MTTYSRADLSALHVVVPVRGPADAKTRLGFALDAEEREVLALGLLAATLDVLGTWQGRPRIVVISDDQRVLDLARMVHGETRCVRYPATDGLNGALVAARRTAMATGATALLILPADLPLLSHAALDGLLEAADAALAAGEGRALVVIAPADARGGTNALLLSPPDIIDPTFGEASLEAHLRAAAAADASLQLVIDPALGFDLDTPDDLERLETRRLLELQRLGEQMLSQAVPAAAATPAAPAEAG